MTKHTLTTLAIVIAAAVAVGVIGIASLDRGDEARGGSTSTSRQEQIARRGEQVMPFDLDGTTHHFQKAGDGLTQAVVADDPANSAEVHKIRAHLRSEATKFRRGTFDDPARIHGASMPGLAELRRHDGRLTIRYRATSDGAQITFSTKDRSLIEALHRWADAQVADHGEHAAHT